MLMRSTSRRDDLISLFYLLSYLLNNGAMPCMAEAFEKSKSLDLRNKFKMVLDAKQTVSLLEMCIANVQSLREFARHIESLQFESTPDYDKLRSILHAKITIDYHQKQFSIYSPRQ